MEDEEKEERNGVKVRYEVLNGTRNLKVDENRGKWHRCTTINTICERGTKEKFWAKKKTDNKWGKREKYEEKVIRTLRI